MLAALVLAASVSACPATTRLPIAALILRLDQATLSPPSLRRGERTCLAGEAAKRLGLAKPTDVLEPDAEPELALGRSELFENLAGRLRAQCEAPGKPNACISAKPAAIELSPEVIDQSQRGFQLWLKVEPGRAARARRLEAFLRRAKVGDVAPAYQLLRTASDWRACGGEPFALPPPEDWPRAAKTLAWIKAQVVPVVGGVELVSGYREPALNACAGGAKQSAHLGFWAVDLEPLDPAITRAGLMQTLCQVHKDHGRASDIGLGFYAGVRFHVDDKRYRHWGFDPDAAPACAVAPADAAEAPAGPASPPD